MPLRLHYEAEPRSEGNKIDDFVSYSWNLIRTIDFSITEAKMKALVNSGQKGTKKYFEWFDNKVIVRKRLFSPTLFFYNLFTLLNPCAISL